ncbi:MAG: TonB-dependent receptor [Bacteroidaceae bacterium]|nr:TonB-dependent receptor [Bacteroidaceae bacterium]
MDTLENVIVTGTRNATDIRHLPLTVTSVNREKIENSHDISLLPVVTQQTPGLFTTSRGMIGYGVSTNSAGAMKIRGVGSGAELLVLIDGQPQYAGLMGHPIPDAYQSMMAEKVEILRGPASLYYGSNAMGGVLNIVTREPKDGVKTNIRMQAGSYGTWQVEGSNMVNCGKFSSFVGVNYGKTDGHRPNSEFEQYAAFAKLGYRITDEWKVAWDMDLTQFNFDNPGPESAPLYDATAKIVRGLTSLSLRNDYGWTNGSIRGYYDWGHHNINDGHVASAAPRKYLYKHDDFIGGISIFQSAQLWDGNRTTVGVDWQHFGGEAWNDSLAGANKYFNKIENQNEIAGYVDFRQDITEWISMDAGIRYDHHSQSGTEWVPQAGVSFHTSSSSDIKALVSKGFRNPVISEMYMFAANTELEPESMMNYELSFQHRGSNGSFGANVYYIDGKNMIERAANPNGAGMLQQNIGTFYNWGFELNGDYRFNRHWAVNANYSFLHMNKHVTGAPEHKLFVQGQYNVGILTLLADMQYINSLYVKTGKTEEVEKYLLFNLSANIKASSNVSLFAKGENLLGQKYQTYAGFWMPKATFMGGMKINF